MGKQHIQVPNNMTLDGHLDPIDVLVYAYLKSYMNNKTLEAFPALATLCSKSGLSINVVRKSLKALEQNGDIKIIKQQGKSSIYRFNPKSRNFEMFTYDFLFNDELTPKQKAYLLVSQQYMFKEGKEGTMSWSDLELGRKIGLSPRVIKTRNKELEDQNMLTITKSTLKDETGLFKEVKIFDLEVLGQAILFLGKKVQEHDDILDDHQKQLDEQAAEIAELKSLLQNAIQNGKR